MARVRLVGRHDLRQRCAFCHDHLQDEPVATRPGCGTELHVDCLVEGD